MVVVTIPVKPFDSAKRRLAEVLSDGRRALLSRELALRTVRAVASAGATPLVVAADEEVAGWAAEEAEVHLDHGSGLDAAAAAGAAWAVARSRPWAVCHADLPLLDATDLAPTVRDLAAGRPVIAPSSDGGTSLIGWLAPDFRFSYGPASFHRHLAYLPDPCIHAALGLLLDLDTPIDLVVAARHPRGAWLRPFLPTS